MKRWQALLLVWLFCQPLLTQALPVVRIAAEDDWAPYSSMKSDLSGPEGLSPQLVREVFALQGYAVEFVTVPFVRCLSYVSKGTALACFNTTITDSNRGQYYWHKTPLFSEELAIFGRAYCAGDDVSLKQLEGKTVGITSAYTYPSYFMNNRRIAKSISSSDSNLLAMLAAKRVDYILLNTMPGYLRINRNPAWRGRIHRVGRISLDGFWLNFSRARPEGKAMAERFEAGLQQLKRSGRYQQIMRDFHANAGIPPELAQLSGSQKNSSPCNTNSGSRMAPDQAR